MLDLHHLPGSDLPEKSILTFRKHPIVMFSTVLTAAVLVVLPPAAYVLIRAIKPDVLNITGVFPIFVMVASAFFLSGWIFIFQSFIDYWLDVFILSDKRILDIDQEGLFKRTVSELRLYRVQDVTAEVTGVLHTFLDYGSIHVQTAGEEERFEFNDISHPNQVAKMILEWSEDDRKEHLEDAVEDFGLADHDKKSGVAKKIEP
jgi:uncharacterized membrane protein YdbT with pleckstrin-like domain